jgi:hypothetical protein
MNSNHTPHRIKPLILRILLTIVSGFSVVAPCRADFVPKEGYVPNAEVAIKIAVAVWEPIYGAEAVAREKPYRATLKEGVWTVQGSLPRNVLGGTALAEDFQGGWARLARHPRQVDRDSISSRKTAGKRSGRSAKGAGEWPRTPRRRCCAKPGKKSPGAEAADG